MATTPNFGFVTPDDSANVNEGAAAMRSLADAVDLELAALHTLGETNYSTITPANNFTADLSFRRVGPNGFLSVGVTRINSNVAATSAVVATLGPAARGNFSTAAQALTMLSTTSPASLGDALAQYDAATGQLTMQWFSAWNTGVTARWTGLVLLDVL